uniref:Uncharacterized protein n=1 Tax=Rhizophora mucronata TaxID=61149 RepID=A0A2P2NZQ7_RHIMU
MDICAILDILLVVARHTNRSRIQPRTLAKKPWAAIPIYVDFQIKA